MNKKTIIKSLSVLSTSFMLFAVGQYVSASEKKETSKYNCIAPATGTWYSGNTLRKVNDGPGINDNNSIGGGKTLNTAICLGNRKASDTRSITSGDRVQLPFKNSS
ncbi:hypothetical protein DP145_13160 [Clostridium tetani]|uniref:hypothetical protein n=1 Tax=Clostridium tetani TaxID=1513 RepID=UPI00100C27A0|nr:hypothetical protein [Clostridium tetani]RXI44024.1 hypothetical protein DP126_12525 [Clostridium tetani]RXM59577.1 hypothetical protein DP138_12800 [Clostridium tetani]RXM63740.1 hypothetical protein DP145_13160 [Clostridium tetani]RXM73587.1 hypothetical protein DP143_04300 [Clostridium tetani]